MRNMFTAADEDGHFMKASTKEYYHLAKMRQQRSWEERLKVRDARYRSVIQNLPTLFVPSSELFLLHAHVHVFHRDYLFDTCAQYGFRKWRFKTKRFAVK